VSGAHPGGKRVHKSEGENQKAKEEKKIHPGKREEIPKE